MQQHKDKQVRGFTHRHMLIILFVFFGTIFSVNGLMVYLASKSWTGLVVKNGYVASQSFNRKISEQETLIAQGWQGQLAVENGQFDYALTQKTRPVSGCKVSGVLKRPVHDRNDQALVFQADGDGLYNARAQLAPGLWVVVMKARCPALAYSFEQRFRFVARAS